MRGLKNKVAVVTGAAGGIGSPICKRFLEEGVNIVAIDLNADALKQLAAGLGAGEDRLLCVTADIADYARVKEAVDRGVAKFGKLDILVNNAGWDVASPFLKTEPDLWEKIIDINLRGPLNLHKAVLPHLVAAGGGKVVNVASDAGRVGSSGEAVYAACKGGLVSFSKTIAREHARHGITVNVVCPGPTDTALFADFKEGAANPEKLVAAFQRSIPLGRIGQPDDLPGAIAFFASDDAAFITGQVLSVSGGLTMAG